MRLTDREEWRPVVRWETFYEVSSFGRVRSCDRLTIRRTPGDLGLFTRWEVGRLLRAAPNSGGYPALALSGGGRRMNAQVHILVCEAFHGPRPPDHDAAHGDGTRTNNRADNLRWATRRENIADRIGHGTMNWGERNAGATLTDAQALKILHNAHRDPLEMAAEFDVNLQAVRRVLRRDTYRHLEVR